MLQSGKTIAHLQESIAALLALTMLLGTILLHEDQTEGSRVRTPVVLPPFGTQLLAVTPHAWDAPQDEVVNASWQGQWHDSEVIGDV